MFEEGEPPEAAIKHAKAKAEREIAREKAKEDAEHKRVEDIKEERQRLDARVSQQRDRELELQFAMENSVRKSRDVLKYRASLNPAVLRALCLTAAATM